MKTFLILLTITFVSFAILLGFISVFGNVGVVYTIPSIVGIYTLVHRKQLKALRSGELEC